MILPIEAVERLSLHGFRPACDVYLLFGYDEETGSENGAAVIVEELKKRGIRFEWILDEGSGSDLKRHKKRGFWVSAKILC